MNKEPKVKRVGLGMLRQERKACVEDRLGRRRGEKTEVGRVSTAGSDVLPAPFLQNLPVTYLRRVAIWKLLKESVSA
jgi:hypothetical protein